MTDQAVLDECDKLREPTFDNEEDLRRCSRPILLRIWEKICDTFPDELKAERDLESPFVYHNAFAIPPRPWPQTLTDPLEAQFEAWLEAVRDDMKQNNRVIGSPLQHDLRLIDDYVAQGHIFTYARVR